MSWVSADTFLKANLDYETSLASEEELPKKRRIPYPEWWDEASCSGQWGAFFFGDSEEEEERPSAVKISDAKKICADCPVFETCLRTALGVGEMHIREEYGIWAGTSTRHRKRIWDLVDGNTRDKDGTIIEAEMEDIIDDLVHNRKTLFPRRISYTTIELVPLKEVV